MRWVRTDTPDRRRFTCRAPRSMVRLPLPFSQHSADFGRRLALVGLDDGLAARADVILLPGRLRAER
jgi:hypothetical protein